MQFFYGRQIFQKVMVDFPWVSDQNVFQFFWLPCRNDNAVHVIETNKFWQCLEFFLLSYQFLMEKYLKTEHCSIDSYVHMFTVPSIASFMVWMGLWTLGKVPGIHFVSVQGKRSHLSVDTRCQNWLCPLYLWASAFTQTLRGCGHLCTLWGREELKCLAVLWEKFKAADGMAL